MSEEAESYAVGKEPCPDCGSNDNLVRYSDGHAYCFSVGCKRYEPPSDEPQTTTRRTTISKDADFIDVEYEALPSRKLTEDTTKKFRYGTGTFNGQRVQVANYYTPDGTERVAQKLRFKNKEFVVLGDIKRAGLFGQHLWRDGGKMVVVTEGEIDALSVSQAQQNKWPVVSIKRGAASAKKDLAEQLEWLLRFDHIVLMLDQDEAGLAAVEECVTLFPPNRCKIAALPRKDANEVLKNDGTAQIIDAIFGAKLYRPSGLVTVADIREKALEPPKRGDPWFLKSLDDLTFGRRYGEAVALGAGTGVGKTDFITQQIAHDLEVLKEPVGCFFLEQQPVETLKRIAGKVAAKRFHIPDGSWTQEELLRAFDSLGEDNLNFYDHFGTTDWEVIESRIRFLRQSKGVRRFWLDHLTALAAGQEDERKALEDIMAKLGRLVIEQDIWLGFVSHLATPEGKPHEEGGRVMIRHFKGSRAIGFWSHFMFGIERNQQADDEDEQSVSKLRVLKDRFTGNATGKVIEMHYDRTTGMLHEERVEDAGF